MRIKIDSLDTLYELLRNPPVAEREVAAGESWKNPESQEETPKKNTVYGFQYHTTGLVYPLEDVSAIFKKFGDNYSCAIAIDAINTSVFNGTHQRFSNALDKLGYKFLKRNPTNDDSTGHIFDPRGSCAFNLFPSNNSVMRVLSMGTGGSYTRFLPLTVDKFLQEMGTLETVSNVFLECLLKSVPETEDIRYLDDKVLYISP